MRPHTAARARSRSTPAVLAMAIGLIALAGCGSSSKSSSSSSTASTPASTATSTPASTATSTPAPATSGSTTLSVAANPEGQLKYTTASLTAKAGAVAINFTNSAPLEHNLSIESASHSVVGTTPIFQGGTKKLSVKLSAGTYKFFCSVPGHRAAGMEGTLTVQ